MNTASVTDTAEVRSGPQASLSLFGSGVTGVAHLSTRGRAVLVVFMSGVPVQLRAALTVPGLVGVSVAVIVVAVVEVVDGLKAVAVVRATVVQSE